MREDGELTELKVEEEKVLIDNEGIEYKVQYKGHVDQKGNVTGWGSYVEPGGGSEGGDRVHTGTFLDGRMEGIVVKKDYHVGSQKVVYITIGAYHKGNLTNYTSYSFNKDGDICMIISNYFTSVPYFSQEGEPLEVYYKAREFD